MRGRLYLPPVGAFDLPPPEELPVVLGQPPAFPCPLPPPLPPLPPPLAILYPFVNLFLFLLANSTRSQPRSILPAMRDRAILGTGSSRNFGSRTERWQPDGHGWICARASGLIFRKFVF
jgi:hypothetical protein